MFIRTNDVQTRDERHKKFIKLLKKKARGSLKRFRRTRMDENLALYLEAKRKWEQKEAEYYHAVRENEKMCLQRAIEENKMKLLWNKIKQITKGNDQVEASITPTQCLEHFKTVHSVQLGQEQAEWRYPDLLYLDATISRSEVMEALNKLSNNKAPGWDGIPTEF